MTPTGAIALTAAACLRPGVCQTDPFLDARYAPEGVRLYVHVRGAADLRRQVGGTPLARFAAGVLAEGDLDDAWNRLAGAAGVEPEELIDVGLGRTATLFVRGAGAASEWALLTEVEPAQSGVLLERLKPRVLGPADSASLLHLPDHELVVARSGARLLIGSRPGEGLWREMIPNLHSPPGQSLGSSSELAEARVLGLGRAALFVRHDPPLGGWSAAVADLGGGQVTLRHAARFGSAPFNQPIVERAWDMTPIAGLEGSSILAFIEPVPRRAGPLEAFIQAGLGEDALLPEMRANLGPRQITTFADIEGRLGAPPIDLLIPTVGRAWEVVDPQGAWPQLDRFAIGLIRKADALRGGPEPTALPLPSELVPGRPRHVEAGALGAWLLGPIPGADRLSLDWTVQSGPQGHWAIVATSPTHLAEVAAALGGQPAGAALEGRWSSCGTFDGRRLGEHLRSWRDRGALLSAPEEAGVFRRGIDFLFGLSEGIERGRWRLDRPSDDRMRLEAELRLVPPDSEQ